MSGLAQNISDYPVLLADLEIFCAEANQLGPPQAARNEQRENCPIASGLPSKALD